VSHIYCSNCGNPTTRGNHGRCPDCHRGNRRAMTTTQRGYGWQHRQRRAALLPAAYGTPCPICHQPMLPGQALDLHHSVPLIDDPTSRGDQIVHASPCNRGGVEASLGRDAPRRDPAPLCARRGEIPF
jgi:hypothetical protein